MNTKRRPRALVRGIVRGFRSRDAREIATHGTNATQLENIHREGLGNPPYEGSHYSRVPLKTILRLIKKSGIRELNNQFLKIIRTNVFYGKQKGTSAGNVGIIVGRVREGVTDEIELTKLPSNSSFIPPKDILFSVQLTPREKEMIENNPNLDPDEKEEAVVKLLARKIIKKIIEKKD